MPEIQFPNTLIVGVGDEMFDFMEPFKPGGVYNEYDRLFMKRTLHAVSTAFQVHGRFTHAMTFSMGVFADNTIQYSDDTYNPNKLIDNVNKLATRIFQWLNNNKAYVGGVFPYVFHDLTPSLAIIFRYDARLGQFTQHRY